MGIGKDGGRGCRVGSIENWWGNLSLSELWKEEEKMGVWVVKKRKEKLCLSCKKEKTEV